MDLGGRGHVREHGRVEHHDIGAQADGDRSRAGERPRDVEQRGAVVGAQAHRLIHTGVAVGAREIDLGALGDERLGRIVAGARRDDDRRARAHEVLAAGAAGGERPEVVGRRRVERDAAAAERTAAGIRNPGALALDVDDGIRADERLHRAVADVGARPRDAHA